MINIKITTNTANLKEYVEINRLLQADKAITIDDIPLFKDAKFIITNCSVRGDRNLREIDFTIRKLEKNEEGDNKNE